MADIRISFPVDLGKGREVTDEVVEQYHQHVEKDVARGFFPLGHNTVWHGGVHVYGGEGATVHALFDGVVVAARLAPVPAEGPGPFGSANFIVVQHEVRGSALNSASSKRKYRNSKYYRFFSLYMHLGSLPLEANEAALEQIGWLTRPAEHALSASVGAGGRNKKADVELVQTLLTQAGIECGPIDGGCGSKTINAIKTLQDTYLYSNPDGRIDLGGSSWKALQFAALGTPARDGIDEALLGELAKGEPINPNKPIAGGQQLWVLGNDTPAAGTWMIQWEVFSEENLFDDFTEVADEGTYTADPTVIRSTLKADAWLPGDDITSQQVAEFYASHPDAKKLRDYVVKFRSEWAADLDAMMAALSTRFWTEGLRPQLEPYMWYPALQADAELPDPLHFHYNPTRFAQVLRDLEYRRELPPPPPPPPPKVDDDDDDVVVPGETDVPPDDEFLLYDAASDMVYVVTPAMLATLMRENDKLARMAATLKQARQDAKDRPRDQQLNAVNPTLKELLAITNTKGDPSDPHGIPELKEFWYKKSNEKVVPIYVGEKKFATLANKVKGSKLTQKFGKVVGTKDGKNNRPVPKFELWDHEFCKDEGTLLDFIDSAHPSLLARMLGGAQADAFFEKYPRLFRKGVGGKYQSPDGHLTASAEVKFLRWAYQAKTTGEFDRDAGKATAKISVGGSVSLIEGKADANFYLPNQTGLRLPVSSDPSHYIGLRLKIMGEVGGFIGATAELAGTATVAWKPQEDGKVGMGVDAGLEAFAGVKVEGKVGAGFEWYNPESREWKVLAEITLKGSAAAGIGATVKFYVHIDSEGTFRIFFKAELTIGVGLGGGVEAKISIQQILDFLWALLTQADWGRILEMSFEAFIQASEMMVGSAMAGVLGPIGLGLYLVANFASWWDDQGKITDMAENILANKAPYLLERGTPEAKGMAIYRLTQASWMWDETSETASLKVLKTARNKREAEKILKSIDPKARDPKASTSARNAARTVQRGYDLLSGLVDWGEQTQLDEYLAGLGISVS